jgi:hypothetical protein
MLVFPVGVEHPLDVAIQYPQHADARHHGWPARYYGANATSNLDGQNYVSVITETPMHRSTKDPHARPAIATLERFHMELGGKLLEPAARNWASRCFT